MRLANVNFFSGDIVYVSFVSIRECVHFVTHANFTALCIIKADFWSISSLRAEAVMRGMHVYQFQWIKQS